MAAVKPEILISQLLDKIIIIIIITQLVTLRKSVEQNDKSQGQKQSRNQFGNDRLKRTVFSLRLKTATEQFKSSVRLVGRQFQMVGAA